jgi:hypothetical protein
LGAQGKTAGRRDADGPDADQFEKVAAGEGIGGFLIRRMNGSLSPVLPFRGIFCHAIFLVSETE